MRRSRHFCFLLLAIASIGGCARQPPRFTNTPIVIVDIDTLRADHLGCYGYERATSPNIDLWSQEAVRFHWAFSQAPNTPPSQTSILASLYPTVHGHFGTNTAVADEIVTLAEVLHGAGYRTAAFVDGGLMAESYGFGQGFEIYDDEAGGVRSIGPKVARWIRRQAAGHSARPQGQDSAPGLNDPFFLLIHTYDVHSPYENSPEPYRSMFLDGLEMPSEHFRRNMSKTMAETWNARQQVDPPRLARTEIDYAKAMYDSGIRHVDDWFGGFVEFLKRMGLYDQVLLVLISDHGDAFQEHGDLFHERIYSEVTRIPFLIRFPQARHRGVFHEVVESIDMMPTLLDLVGAQGPAAMQGKSLMPLIRGMKPPADVALSESPYFGRRIALTTARHRLLYSVRSDEAELYRYREDLLEQNDLAAQEAQVAMRLKRAVKRWDQEIRSRDRVQAGRVKDLAPETIEQLRTLGYLD